MARMSIDDKFLRDPRITQLGIDLGWSKWEVRGRLLAVFAVCYDLERDVLTAQQIDIAAEQPGLADAMFAQDLVVTARGGLRIKGAGERIAYLSHKAEAGRIGGVKSGKSRRESAKQNRSSASEAERSKTREAAQARGNPPDPVPDPPPDPVPVPDLPDPDLSPARVATPGPGRAGDPALARRQALRAELWRELGTARSAIGSELRVEHRPLAAQDPGERALAMLLVGAGEALDATVADVRHAIAIAAAEARRDRSLQWLTGVIFDERNFRRLAATTLEDARRPRPTKPGEPARMPARRADPPVVVVSDADRADAADELAAARTKLFGVVDGGAA